MATELHRVSASSRMQFNFEQSAMDVQIPEIVNDASSWPNLSQEKRGSAKQTILLVEDEDFVRRVARQILCDAGYAVLAAKKSSEALLVYEQHHLDVELLLTDVVLPGENGHALAQKIHRINPSIKVLFMTGYAERMGQELVEHEGFLAKPFASAELLRRVAQLLETRSADAHVR
jgi:CheY-like chemotaxis protein